MFLSQNFVHTIPYFILKSLDNINIVNMKCYNNVVWRKRPVWTKASRLPGFRMLFIDLLERGNCTAARFPPTQGNTRTEEFSSKI
jgi:hypothetical protein